MTNFESLHPRESSGKFTDKPQSQPELALGGSVRVDEDGTKTWLNAEGQWHREDGPAVERADGSKEWRINGVRHRLDGPALIHADGGEVWVREGRTHREDGPAVTFSTGDQYWFINGVAYTEEEFLNIRDQN